MDQAYAERMQAEIDRKFKEEEENIKKKMEGKFKKFMEKLKGKKKGSSSTEKMRKASGDNTGSGGDDNPDDYIVTPLNRHGATGGGGKGGQEGYVPQAMYRFGAVATFPGGSEACYNPVTLQGGVVGFAAGGLGGAKPFGHSGGVSSNVAGKGVANEKAPYDDDDEELGSEDDDDDEDEEDAEGEEGDVGEGEDDDDDELIPYYDNPPSDEDHD